MNKKRSLIIKLTFAANFFLLLLPAAVAEEKIFVFSEFCPYEYMEKGEADGINIYLIKQVCSRMGIEPVFRELPWKRALRNAETGDADAVFSLFKTDEREKLYNYTDNNLNTVKMVLFTNSDRELKIESMQDLKGFNIGVYRGSSYGYVFDTSFIFTRDVANSNENIIKKQLNRRTDAFVMDENVAEFWLEKLNCTDLIKPVNFTIFESKTYIAFSKLSDNNIKLFSSLLAEEKRLLDKQHNCKKQ